MFGHTMRAARSVVRGVAVVGAIVIAGSALAGASGSDREGTFTGCVHRSSGMLRVIDDRNDHCQKNERRITWNEQGPAGPQGLAGSIGSLDELEGSACHGNAGTLAITYAPDGAVLLRCASEPPPPPPPPGDCGDLLAFDPRSTGAYDDYPINNETADNQYRSYLRGGFVPVIQNAASLVLTTASGWTSGHGAPVGLGDMSECDGSIPGTSIGEPGHPAGTHTGGLDIDVAYFQTGTPDNRIRPVCESAINRVEQNHCVAPPDRLDARRSALFLEALASSGMLRVVGVDGQIGPVLESALQSLCAEGFTDCTPVPLAYETTDEGQGWFNFHHHHMHISFNEPSR